jgi:uncharacterized Rossmann fold enzyme
MKKLELTVQAAGTPEELCSNIRSALARGLPELTPAPTSHDGTFVCVASGWSMPSFIDEIRAQREMGRPIVAVKAAHDYLCDHGIDPDIWVNLDPRDRTNGIQKANDHTVYFVASRCPPITFDHLKDRKIMLWHSWSDGPECKALPGGKLAIGGGTTSGMRAINIGYLLGYRKFVLYGYDSCNDAEGKKRFTGEMTGPTLDVYVGAEKRKFTCNAAMAQQANEFQMLYAVMPDITVEAKGPGLIAAIIDERKRLKFVA